jgi:DNA (cytosine-5)-methyltransferase 3A
MHIKKNNMKRYNYAIDVAFEVQSDEEQEPTIDECLKAMEDRLNYLKENRNQANEAFDVTMNVLSLFDGMSCGRIALERAGIKVDNYFACEIDKYAVSISKKNYPDIVQLGDVTKVHINDLLEYPILFWGDKQRGIKIDTIDLVIGGSPCQSFSRAGDGSGFDGSSALFWEYVRILKEARAVNPNVKFLLENVVMKQEWQDIITEAVGVEPVKFNSKLVSAQSRPRLYWTNIEGFELPEYMDRERDKGRSRWEYHKNNPEGKAGCLTANMYKGVPYGCVILDKPNRIASVDIKGHDYIRRVYDECGKAPTLTSSTGGNHQPKVLDREREEARRLTPLECERLQTVPEGYTEGCSNTQRYKMLGNGWTVDAIVEFFKHLK